MTLQPQRVMLVTELSGHASASARVEVRPQVTGTLLQRQFEEGTDVRAGQVLYQIDPRTYQVAFNSAKAALSLAEAMELAGRVRARRAGDPNAIEQQDDDDAAATHEQAQADVMAGRAALDRARIELAATRIEAPSPVGSAVRQSQRATWWWPTSRPRWQRCCRSTPSMWS